MSMNANQTYGTDAGGAVDYDQACVTCGAKIAAGAGHEWLMGHGPSCSAHLRGVRAVTETKGATCSICGRSIRYGETCPSCGEY